jgi:LacI family transcriptional regulator
VSRVLNAPESVNRDARIRVEAAVRELGYTRNGAARALRSRRSQMVGVILPTLKQAIYADFIGTLQDGLARHSYALVVTTSDYCLERELFQARLLVERGIDALVLVGHTHRPELYDLLGAQDLPFLTTYSFWPGRDHPMVGFDNFAAMGTIVDHLYGLGHRDFAVLADSSANNDRVEQRIAGAVARLAERGIVLPADRIVEDEFTIEGGRSGLGRLLQGGQPTALLCTSDVLAYGALVECRARRIDVPGALSVVGYDSLQSSAYTLPALTSLEIPSDEMARRAASYILARLAGRSHPDQVEIKPRLILRDTTAPPPGTAESRR